jgi:hypothetical protein
MKKQNYNEMSNSEIKMHIDSLRNEFEHKKLELKKICEEMDAIENEYISATNELDIRRNLYL